MAGSKISKTEAIEMSQRFRETHRGQTSVTRAHQYSNDVLSAIMTQPGCMGIRFYNGLDENSVACLVLVGVDMQENDMVDGELADRGSTCPPYCVTGSELNG